MNIETKMAVAKASVKLHEEGMQIGFKHERDGWIRPFIPAQPIPDIHNWREWCGKLQACGVLFEFDWGTEKKPDWRLSECLFCLAEINDFRIPKQPVSEKIANYLNEEKTMSENINKPKSIKLRLPEIEVSEDVDSMRIYLSDKNGMTHNLAGLAVMNFNIKNGGIVGVGDYQHHYIHGNRYTEEDFKLATQPPKELTVQEVEKLLGYKIKIVGKTE